MICLRGVSRHLSSPLLASPLLSTPSVLRRTVSSEIILTADRRRVFKNRQLNRATENRRMIKELEVPNMDADSEKPGMPTIDRYVPEIPLIPAACKAPRPDTVRTHAPIDLQEYTTMGELMWKTSDGCLVCNKNLRISYKDVSLLYQFVTNSGQMIGPDQTGLCQLSHHMVANAIKIARELGLMAIDYKPLEYQQYGTYRSFDGVKDVGR